MEIMKGLLVIKSKSRGKETEWDLGISGQMDVLAASKFFCFVGYYDQYSKGI